MQPFNLFWQRLYALIKKEVYQLLRDKSSLSIGLFLPIVLIFIFGNGLSLDVKNVPVAVVLEEASPTTNDIASTFTLSSYFNVTTVMSMQEAKQLMQERQVEAIIRFPNHFSEHLAQNKGKIQLILRGTDVNTANTIRQYVINSIGIWQQKQLDRSKATINTHQKGMITIEPRMWFNAANTSTWYLVPGLIVLIITLVGTFLTSLVVAKEWERGTLESLFVTPVRPIEILMAKIIPYFLTGVFGLVFCLLAAKFLFEVPIYGSMIILVCSSLLYLIVCLGIGLLISSVTKNQFLASQIAIIFSTLPSMMLSGFIFDLRNAPAIIRFVGELLPATYFMELIKTLFLAGNVWPIVIKNVLVLLIYAIVFVGLARVVTKKKLY
ncbi:ABC transporter permease [Neisseria sp. Ec49-e6-T10]|uniref:ABC transporter permease n=1 Tax=Neisseria sp. Ec49-e6-T10 TaxID=3140744 RepID=UPI003EBAA2D9